MLARLNHDSGGGGTSEDGGDGGEAGSGVGGGGIAKFFALSDGWNFTVRPL